MAWLLFFPFWERIVANDINFELKGIGQILAQNRLVVPLNQREYAWEKDHVKELFQDFSNALAKGKGGSSWERSC